jgi:hypothetical protein
VHAIRRSRSPFAMPCATSPARTTPYRSTMARVTGSTREPCLERLDARDVFADVL